jgi:hypothetical protein
VQPHSYNTSHTIISQALDNKNFLIYMDRTRFNREQYEETSIYFTCLVCHRARRIMIIDPEQIRAARERLRETCNYTRPATRMPRALVYCALLFMGLGFMCGLASEARSTFSLLPEPCILVLGDTPAAKGAMEQATDFLRTPSPAKRTTNGTSRR